MAVCPSGQTCPSISFLLHMSQVRIKPACSADETSYGLEISAIASSVEVLYYPGSEQQRC